MLDPYWIAGTSGHVKRTSVKALVILCRDAVSPAVRKLEADEALRLLEGGSFPSGAGPMRANPFLNPHLLIRSSDRFQLQRFFFARIFQDSSLLRREYRRGFYREHPREDARAGGEDPEVRAPRLLTENIPTDRLF